MPLAGFASGRFPLFSLLQPHGALIEQRSVWARCHNSVFRRRPPQWQPSPVRLSAARTASSSRGGLMTRIPRLRRDLLCRCPVPESLLPPTALRKDNRDLRKRNLRLLGGMLRPCCAQGSRRRQYLVLVAGPARGCTTAVLSGLCLRGGVPGGPGTGTKSKTGNSAPTTRTALKRLGKRPGRFEGGADCPIGSCWSARGCASGRERSAGRAA